MSIIYLLECVNGDETLYKIGYTRDSVQKRIEKLQTGNGYQIREVSRFLTNHGQKVERSLHNFYGHYRKEGEWFNLGISEVVNFNKLCERIESNFDFLSKKENII